MVVQYEHTEYCQAVYCQMKEDTQLEGMVMGPLCLRIHCLSFFVDSRVHLGNPGELRPPSETGPVGTGLTSWL